MEASDQEERRARPAEAPASANSKEVEMTDEPWKGRREDLLLVNEATDRELDDFTRRDSAMQSRATILIGAASLIGALKLGQGVDWLVAVNLLLSFLAAGCGVVVLFPRSGDAPNPRQMRDALYGGVSDAEALHNMVRVKLDALDKDEESLDRRVVWIKTGFILLTLSVLTAAIGAAIPLDGVPAPKASSSVATP